MTKCIRQLMLEHLANTLSRGSKGRSGTWVEVCGGMGIASLGLDLLEYFDAHSKSYLLPLQ